MAILTALLTLALVLTMLAFAAYGTWAYFDDRRFEKCLEERGVSEAAASACGR